MATAIPPPCAGHVQAAAGPERQAGDDCPDKTGTLVATVAGSSLAFVVGSIVNVALPSMQREFALDAAGAQWIVNAYLLPLGALVLIGGALGDHYGRRRAYLTGLALFAAASVACAFAPSYELLLAARALLGLAAALVAPTSLSIIADGFSGAERGKAIGTWAAGGAIAGAVAPLAGGWIVDFAGWRWAFGSVGPLAIGAWLIAFHSVRESKASSDEKAPLDWLGAGLVAAALFCTIYGLIALPGEQSRIGAIMWLIGGGILMVAFTTVEKRKGSAAMAPPALFVSRSFTGISLLTFFLYAALGGLLVLLPYVLIARFGYSGVGAGAALLPFPLIMGTLSRKIGGEVVEKFGTRKILAVGSVLVACGFTLMSLMPDTGMNYWRDVLPGLVIMALGMAACVAPLTNAVIAVVDDAFTGVASGVNNATSRIAGLVATAMLGPVLAAGDAIVAGFGLAALVAALLALLSAASAWFMIDDKDLMSSEAT